MPCPPSRMIWSSAAAPWRPPSATFEADVAISGETIAAIGRGLPDGAAEIDARGKLVLPGGVDSHAHIEQISSAGLLNADTFESATVSAAFGGTTTVISFAAQHVGMQVERSSPTITRSPARARSSTTPSTSSSPIRRRAALAALPQAHPRRSWVAEGVHDLRQDPARRRAAARRDDGGAREPRPGLRPCREPRHDRLDGKAPARPRLSGAQVSRRQPSAPRRGRGVQPAHLFRRAFSTSR